MKKVVTINKKVAPKNYKDFKRWYKAACSLSFLSAEEAYKSLGYEIESVKEEIKPIRKKYSKRDSSIDNG